MKLVAHTIHLPEGMETAEAMMVIPGDLSEFSELHRAAYDLAQVLDASGSDRARAALAALLEMLGRGRVVGLRADASRRFDA